MSRAAERFQWDDEAIERVADMLRSGATGSFIARQLGTTRNSVVGKVFRNKELSSIGFCTLNGAHLAARAAGKEIVKKGYQSNPAKAPVVKAKRQKLHPGNIARKKASRIKDPVEVKPAFSEDMYNADALQLLVHELGPRQCKWPVNDAPVGTDHLFCGKPTDPTRSYCNHHARKAVGRGTESERSATRIALSLVGRS